MSRETTRAGDRAKTAPGLETSRPRGASYAKPMLYILPVVIGALLSMGVMNGVFVSSQADEGSAQDPIQPGAKIARGTLGFFFYSMNETDDEGAPLLYASTHGHGSMEGRLGDPVRLAGSGRVIGSVVAQEKDGYNDWSLIRIDEAVRGDVDVAVRGWGGPTAMPTPRFQQAGDVACMVGHGTDKEREIRSRERCGELQSTFTFDNVTGFRYTALTGRGDSGSPIIHYESGQALGIHLGRGLDGLARAVDICSLMEQFQAHDFTFTLATAPYAPPAVAPHAQADGRTQLDTFCLGAVRSTSPSWAYWEMQGGGFEPPNPFGTGS